MKAVPLLIRLSVAVGLLVSVANSGAQELARQKLTTGHVPIEVLRPALEKVLSAEGRFVMLPGKGEILVIDHATHIEAAAKSISTLEVPPPQVGLDFAFKTNVAPGMVGAQPIDRFGDFPFPTRWQAPQIIQNGNIITVVPAHPTNFQRRAVGDVFSTGGTVNPDGSITVDINHESTEFEGFINYGSGIFTSGIPGVVPVVNGVGNPTFFRPFLERSNIVVPVFETTRINTQILLRPHVAANQVHVEMIPQLEIELEEPGAEATKVPLTEFKTGLDIRNGQIGKIAGFDGASAEFNRHFLGAKEEDEGGTAIQVRASIRAGALAEEKSDTPPTNSESPTEAGADVADSAP